MVYDDSDLNRQLTVGREGMAERLYADGDADRE